MANMFSGNQEKKIPKSFKDCYKTDSITKNLWLWCERLEKWGFILFWILIAMGIIDTIIAGINAHELIEQIGAETVEEIREASAEMGIEIPTVFEALVNNLLSWTLYSFLEYCAYHILALLVGSLATIVQHTKITANITLYNSAKAEGITDDDNAETENADNIIKCNNKTHEIYISEIKDANTNSENAHWEESKLTGTKRLVCNHCGKELMYIDNQEKSNATLNYSEKDIRCPKCKQKLSVFPNEKNLVCPYCETEVHID